MALHNYINQKPNSELGFFPSGASARYANPTGTFDYAIGGIPFLSASGTSIFQYGLPRAYQRSTAQFKREQFDNSPEPGEQSLMGWWLRSQASFHFGSGLKFEDPSHDENRARYESSAGVDVLTTPGQVTLLPGTTKRVSGTSPVRCIGAVDGTTDVVFFSTGATLNRVTSGASTAVTWGGAGNILSLTEDGSNYYAANATSIFKGTLAGGAGAALWNTGNANVVIGWVKQRLMAGIGPSVYQLAGGAPPALPTATYTHPNSAWVWTAFAEGPDAMFVAGYAGGRSTILKISVDSTGALPTLTQASTVAEMPPGEIVYSLRSHTGTYLAIGTSKGVRVAQFGASGTLAVGPLVTTPNPVKSLTVWQDSFYAGYTGGFADGSGLLRISLSQQLTSGKYPYAPDLNAHVSGDVTGVCVRGVSGVLAFVVDGQGLYETDPANLEPSGTLTTYRIRFSAQWPKLFKRLGLRSLPPYNGTIGISTIDQTGTSTAIATVAPSLDPRTDVTLNRPLGPQQHIQLQFQLNRDANPLNGPTLSAYQLKALPGGPRPRELVLPVHCYDFERDRTGATVGYEGWSAYRLNAMEALDSAGDLVLFEDLVSGNSQLVLIEALNFRMGSPPGAQEYLGGVMEIQCRTVD